MSKRDLWLLSLNKVYSTRLSSSCHCPHLFSHLQCKADSLLPRIPFITSSLPMKRTGTSLESRKAAQANSPKVAVSRCSFTGASCQGNGNYPLCAADGATALGLEEILECCSSFPVSHGNHELWCVLNVSFPHISLRILLAFSSDYLGLTAPVL